jgi:hypothetical protein
MKGVVWFHTVQCLVSARGGQSLIFAQTPPPGAVSFVSWVGWV